MVGDTGGATVSDETRDVGAGADAPVVALAPAQPWRQGLAPGRYGRYLAGQETVTIAGLALATTASGG